MLQRYQRRCECSIFESFVLLVRERKLIIFQNRPRASTSTGATNSSSSNNSAAGALQTLIKSYRENTPPRLKLVDIFCIFLVILGVMQFAYCILITDFPFNSFLAG